MAVRTKDKDDRRANRTRKSLREALLALVHERGWEAVSVQDLCERADVGRSTFYIHYTDKEALLLEGLDDLRANLQRAPGHGAGGISFLDGLVDHAFNEQRLFRALVGRGSGQIILARFRTMLLELVEHEFLRRLPTGLRREAAAHFIAGGILDTLAWWLESRNPVSPDDMKQVLGSLIVPVLSSRD